MDALGISLPGLVTQVVSFLILFALLYKLLYNPVLRALDQRSNRIKESLEAAQKARDEAAESQADMKRQLDGARAEGQQLVARARDAAGRFRDQELVKAREEIQTERDRARGQIQRERDVAIEELRREFSSLAIMAAERVIERSLDETAHKELIEKVLEEGPQVDGISS